MNLDVIKSPRQGSFSVDHYSSHFELLDGELLYAKKSHSYQKKTYHESFASDWTLLWADLPPDTISIRSGDKVIPLAGPTILFMPPFTIVELHTAKCLLAWELLASSNSLPGSACFQTPILLAGPKRLPKSKAEVIDLMESLKDGTRLVQEKKISSVAEKAKRYIDHHFCENLKIGEMALRLNFSREVLTREFKSTYGLSPIDYRHRLRLFEALIKVRSKKSFTDALFEVGFSDPSQFITQFKKTLGALPRQYKL